ncbi:hypothetical protein AX769_03455 [Frondihabitans sp. PAMC 28766]|uniref:phosphotransferase n=1 Tax=Frondihabitans sp. PAMC 28766 TaxID=1795630 RepID=UPI00078D01C6|nr:phosphotransferase [Frondihabitans sp. PAMC 28766]AMM19361.1 hypothetical protein AX769_03455 [Frondihabitans sp. PAMC 28766]
MAHSTGELTSPTPPFVRRDLNQGAFDLHRREIAVMSVLPPTVSAPALLGSYDEDGWVALVLSDIEGRHPGRAGDGSDAHAVLDAFATFPLLEPTQRARLPRVSDEIADEAHGWRELTAGDAASALPAWVRDHLGPLQRAADSAPAEVDGEYLQHLDSRADNVLVDAGSRAWIIDWPWAGVGARWVDGLMYLFDCRVRGETVDADEILGTHPLFDGVADSSIDAVLSAVTGGFFAKAGRPAPPDMPTLRDFQRTEALAGSAWLQERWG